MREFIDVARQHGLSADEAERLAYPSGHDWHLWDLLKRAHAHNAAILARHGYHCPQPSDNPGDITHLSAYRTAAEITEPEAKSAADVIDAVGELARALRSGDKARVALAGLHFGATVGRERLGDYESGRRAQGGATSAQRRRDRAAAHWSFDEVFPTAYVECLSRYGKVTARPLAYVAEQVARRLGCSDREREDLTAYRAAQFIKKRPPD